MEIFKDIPWYEWLYQVSNLGNIKSLQNNKWDFREKLLSIKKEKNWYLRVAIYSGKIKKYYSVHRLVWSAFLWLELQNRKALILHKNDIRDDNRVENLTLWTHKDNSQDCLKKWRWTDNSWERNWMRKLTEEQVKSIRLSYTWKRWEQTRIAKKYAVPISNIWQIVHWLIWKNI